jgi:hypothetical protein
VNTAKILFADQLGYSPTPPHPTRVMNANPLVFGILAFWRLCREVNGSLAYCCWPALERFIDSVLKVQQKG